MPHKLTDPQRRAAADVARGKHYNVTKVTDDGTAYVQVFRTAQTDVYRLLPMGEPAQFIRTL